MEIKEALIFARDLAAFLRRCSESESIFSERYKAEAEALDVICNALEEEEA